MNSPTRRVQLSRALTALASSLLVAALVAPAAFARAGSGSSSFGGRSSGGGFSGGGHSSYGGSSGGVGGTGTVIVFGIIVVIVVVYWIYRQAVNAFVSERMRRRRRERVARISAAAAEAAEDDAAFSSDAVRGGAEQLFRQIQDAWSRNDIATLETLVGGDLMVEWRRRLQKLESKRWHNVVEVLGDVNVEYVGLVNRADDADDRCVVRITARLRDYVTGKSGQRVQRNDSASDQSTMKEYWTLGKRDGGWRLLSIEQDREGAHHIDSAIVTTPWGDDERLRDEALVEGAVADKIVDGYRISDVADLDFDGDARAAALDLSLADARFAPDILETAARRAVGGWAEAVDGEDDELLAVATPEALHSLLYPGGGDRRRLVVRGPRIERLRIAALDAAVEPPTMAVEVDVRGRRYVQDRDTAGIVSGSDSREVTFSERWVMALAGDDRNPWRIVRVGGAAPAARSQR